MQSSSVTIINGRVQKNISAQVLRIEITPLTEGEFTVPSIPIVVDGPDTVDAGILNRCFHKSETGDLLFAEIVGKHPSIYVGQAIDLTLKIWIKPYRDRDSQATLSISQMLRLVSEPGTRWGPFAESWGNNKIRGQEVLRPDNDGRRRSYYLYEIDATVYPQRPGQIDGDDVQIAVQYPTKMGKSRDPFASIFGEDRIPFSRSSLFDDGFFGSAFGSQLTIQSVRAHRCKRHSGADRRQADSRCWPTTRLSRRGWTISDCCLGQADGSERAGDPITLQIGIEGTGPMDLVQAPPLAELDGLIADFRVPDEPLAGMSDGTQKVFTTSIRPRAAGVSEIPPIPMTYFDPDKERFVTVYSAPIPIHVEPSENSSPRRHRWTKARRHRNER